MNWTLLDEYNLTFLVQTMNNQWRVDQLDPLASISLYTWHRDNDPTMGPAIIVSSIISPPIPYFSLTFFLNGTTIGKQNIPAQIKSGFNPSLSAFNHPNIQGQQYPRRPKMRNSSLQNTDNHLSISHNNC